MPARFGFPSAVRGGAYDLPWADAGSGASVTDASNANPATTRRLRVMSSSTAKRLQGSLVARTLQSLDVDQPDIPPEVAEHEDDLPGCGDRRRSGKIGGHQHFR